MFIYAFIHLHINILKPLQCLNLILRQLFCFNFSSKIQSSQFKSHSTGFFRYTCIYIYTISNQHCKAFTVSTATTSTGLCATCTRQETRMSFCVLTCTRASFPVRENSPSCGFSGQKTLQKRLSKQASFLAGVGVPATNLSPCMECLNVSNTETKYTHAYLLDLLCIPSTE